MAASSVQVLSIKPFDGTGYSNWEYRVKLMLEQKDVLDVISKEPPEAPNQLEDFKKNDVKARNLIVQCLADNILEMIKDRKTAKEIMDTLRGTYLKKGIANQVQLQRKLRTLRYCDREPLNVFLTEFEQTISELRNSGGTIQNCEVITQLLSAMPESYQAVTTAIDVLFCQNEENVTLEFVKNKLLMEEARQKKDKTEAESSVSEVFVGYKKSWKNKSRSEKTENRKDSEFRYRCYACGQKGHKRSQCLKNVNKSNIKCNVTEREEEEEIAFLTSSQESVKCYTRNERNEIIFVVDSGATNHLVNSNFGQYLVNTQEVHHKINVAKLGVSCSKTAG